MKFRSMLLSLAAISMLVFGSVANAQDFDLCFGLDAADCDAIAAAGVGDATSFTIDYSIDFSLGGLAAVGAPQDTFSFVNDGTIDLAEGTNPVLPIEAGFSATAQFDDLVGVGVNDVALEARLLDGTFYLQNPLDSTWAAIDVLELMSSPEFGEALEDLPFDPMSGDLGDVEGMPDMNAILSLLDLIELPGLVSYVREGNTFVFTIDLTVLQLLTTPEYEEELNQIIEIASEIDPSLAFLIPTIPALVQEGIIEVVQVIDGETLQRIEFNVALDVALGMLTGDMSAAPLTANLLFSMDITNLNDATIPAAPADAVPVGIEDLGL